MDWNRHWKGFEGDEEMRAAGRRMADRLDRFFNRPPASLADIGCGPAHTLFAFAGRHPDVECRGYDVADSIVERNRKRAERGARQPRVRG